MPDQQLLIHFLIPAVAVGVISFVAIQLSRHWLRGYVAGACAALLFPLAALIGLFLQEGIQIPPGRDWHYVIWLGVITSLFAALLQFRNCWTPIPAALSAAFAWLGCKYVLPAVGEDAKFDLIRNAWAISIVVAVFLNVYFLRLVTILGGSRWSILIIVAQFGGITAAIMSAYATLSAVSLSYLAVTLVLAIAALATQRNAVPFIDRGVGEEREHQLEDARRSRTSDRSIFLWLSTIQLPATVTAALLVASFRNYNYAETATWIYGVLLILPAVVCLIDLVVVRPTKPKLRVIVAGLVAAALLGITLLMLFQSSGEGW